MKELPRPPEVDWPTLLQKYTSKFGEKELKEYLAKTNSKYLHWEELRYVPTPPGITKEEGWGFVKLSRMIGKPLPLKDQKEQPFKYWLPEATQELLHDIDQHASGIVALHPDEQDIGGALGDRVLVSSLIDEAIATSKIEGAVTTWKVAQRMLKEGRKPGDKSEQMIVNSYRMIQKLKERIEEPLSVELLHQIQSEITYKTLENPDHSGRFRTENDDVHVVDQVEGEIVYTPPSAKELNRRMQKLIQFANTQSIGSDFIHPFVKAAILHFWLAYEHPYCDGNGRTARVLIYWFLLKHKYWLFQYLPLSKIVVEAPGQYYRSFLYSEKDENDLTYSVVFMAGVARKAIEKLKKDLANLKLEQQALTKSIQKVGSLNHRQRAILKELITNPEKSVSIQYQKNTHNITYQTARTDLLELVRQGYLKKTKEKKKFLFVLSAKVPSK